MPTPEQIDAARARLVGAQTVLGRSRRATQISPALTTGIAHDEEVGGFSDTMLSMFQEQQLGPGGGVPGEMPTTPLAPPAPAQAQGPTCSVCGDKGKVPFCPECGRKDESVPRDHVAIYQANLAASEKEKAANMPVASFADDPSSEHERGANPKELALLKWLGRQRKQGGDEAEEAGPEVPETGVGAGGGARPTRGGRTVPSGGGGNADWIAPTIGLMGDLQERFMPGGASESGGGFGRGGGSGGDRATQELTTVMKELTTAVKALTVSTDRAARGGGGKLGGGNGQMQDDATNRKQMMNQVKEQVANSGLAMIAKTKEQTTVVGGSAKQATGVVPGASQQSSTGAEEQAMLMRLAASSGS